MSVSERERRPRVKRLVVGRPMTSAQLDETLLSKVLALPIFAADALSSVAYATESALAVLVAASLASGHLVLPVSIAVAALLAVVILSYTQTVRAYETSGGAYIVAKDNFGTFPSLLAASALLIDYVLTVAVSVAAGVFAITSVAHGLDTHKTALSLAAIALISVANLRGVREAGAFFALPTYGFILVLLALVGTGVTKCAIGSCPQAHVPHPATAGTASAVGLFVLLRAFASGSSALTGVEAIANGVSAFKRPQARNAAQTLGVLGVLAVTFFLGVSYLAVHTHAGPSETTSVVAQIARAVFPAGSATGFVYYLVQAFTFAVLVLAANTSYQGFPRLAALLARDRFIPRQFTNLGDRLVFSNGIVVLTASAGALIVIYHAQVDRLIHLYVIGVFTAFTISQAGMVRYWVRRRGRRWRSSLAVNALGAAATGVVTVIVVITKFTEGAYLVTIAIPVVILGFYGVRRHYRRFARRLVAGAGAVRAAGTTTNRVLVVAEAIDVAAEGALWYARRIGDGSERAVHVPGRHTDPGIRPRWADFAPDGPCLEVLGTEQGRVDAVLEEVWALPRGESSFVTVVMPEYFRRRSLLDATRHKTWLLLKLRLLSEAGVVIANVPAVAPTGTPQGRTPKRLAGRLLVAGVHAGTLRALNYAKTLGLDDLRAVSFAFDAEEAAAFRREWRALGSPLPLDLVEAPYRDMTDPLRDYIRELTSDLDVAVNIVMPEVIVRGWSRLLHNQRALYVKRQLLFEPHVILSSVPYQVFR